jgi:uncharacterized protein YeaO (DUF488 family)
MTVTINRIYDAQDDKGTRILVDRVWLEVSLKKMRTWITG